MDSLGSEGRRPLRKGQATSRTMLPLLQTHFAVSKVLASADDLTSVVPTIIASICINLGWEVGAFWQYTTNRPVLICTHISAANEALGTFIAESRKNELMAGEGLPGKVFSTSEAAWIPDLSDDENFQRNSMAAQAGLKSSLAFPVLVGNDAIVTMDESGNIMLANCATEKMFGYPLSEIKGQSLFMLLPEHVRARYEQLISRYLESGKKRPHWHGVEITGLHKDGHEVLLEVSFGEFNLKGQRFFTGFMRDITLRKKLESVLRSTERLTVIGRLAASIAHE